MRQYRFAQGKVWVEEETKLPRLNIPMQKSFDHSTVLLILGGNECKVSISTPIEPKQDKEVSTLIVATANHS